jgi:DNA-binding CsgD family transcriptional regulator
MKNYQDSEYAANKYNAGIVYRFADTTVVITPADYLAENPGKTAEDFRKLKAESDAIYREQDRKNNAQTKKNVALDDLRETELDASSSPEKAVIDVPEEAERRQERVQLASRALEKLTEVQRRRYQLNKVNGLSTYEIARLEGTNHKTVYESLQAAEKKIKKFLAEA